MIAVCTYMARLPILLGRELQFEVMALHEKPETKLLLWNGSMGLVVIHCGGSLL